MIGAPPAERVWEPIKKVGAAEVPAAAMACVLPPATIVAPFEARETGVPETVIWPPGVRVCEPITKADEESAAIVELPTVITAPGEVVGFPGSATTPPALEVEDPGPGSAVTGEVDGDGFTGLTASGEVEVPGSTASGEVGVPGSTATGDEDTGSTAGVLLDAGGGSAAVGTVVAAATGVVVEPGEAGSAVLVTGAALVIGSAVGVVVVDENALSPP